MLCYWVLNIAHQIGEAFDLVFDYMDTLMLTDWDDSKQEEREAKACKLKDIATELNEAETRALTSPVFSEYQTVVEHVIPEQVRLYGKLVLRANEQGQESLGALLKRQLKNGVNKRRRVKTALRKGKDGEMRKKMRRRGAKMKMTGNRRRRGEKTMMRRAKATSGRTPTIQHGYQTTATNNSNHNGNNNN